MKRVAGAGLSMLAVLWLAACGTHFESYDYERSEDAKLKGAKYDIKIHGRQLRLERKLPFPVK